MNYSLVLFPEKKKKKEKTPTLIHVQTLNTKKLEKKKKKNLLPRNKSFQFFTKFTILISFISP